MKKIKFLLLPLLAISLAGCASNPLFNKQKPVSEANPQYVADTNFLAKVATTGNTIHAVNDAIPGNPYAGIIDTAITLIVGGITAGAGVGIRAANILAAHKKAGQTLANVVAGAGGSLAALANAPDQKTAGIIAEHLQDAPLPNVPPPKSA